MEKGKEVEDFMRVFAEDADHVLNRDSRDFGFIFVVIPVNESDGPFQLVANMEEDCAISCMEAYIENRNQKNRELMN